MSTILDEKTLPAPQKTLPLKANDIIAFMETEQDYADFFRMLHLIVVLLLTR
ncbi:MAG: hypothetical protein QM752_07695 [Gammaproteobacteria bacterium]